MKLRKFLEKSIKLCSENELLVARITEDVVDKYNKEMKNPNSVYKMHKQDFEDPAGRLSFMFSFKNLDEVDTRIAERIFNITYLVSLYSYKEKYETTEFNTEIRRVELEIEAQPVPEVEVVATEVGLVATRGTWSD